MLGLLNLLNHHLDLDAAWVGNQQFDQISDEEFAMIPPNRFRKPDWSTCLAWFAPLLKHALDAEANAVHLICDEREDQLRQLLYVPNAANKNEYVWFEVLPMPLIMGKVGLKAISIMSIMFPWTSRGVIHYRYKGMWRKADCHRASRIDLAIYFGDARPLLRSLW